MAKAKRKPKDTPAPGIMRRLIFERPGCAPPAFWLFILPVLVFVAAISWCRIDSHDLWWHLKTGEWIVQQHAIPRADPFSYTALGQPWIAHEWLFGLTVYLIYAAAGFTGLAGIKVFFVAAACGIAAWIARERGASPGMTAMVLAAAYAVSRQRFSERPELLSLPIALAFLLIHEKSRRRPKLLLLLPVLELVWVNVHGGTAPLGWFLAGACLLDRARELHVPGSSWKAMLKRRESFWSLGAAVGVAAASVINPSHIRALTYGMLRAESPLNIQEFESLGTRIGAGIDATIVLFIAFASITAAFLLLRPRRARPQDWLLFPALLALAIVFFRFRSLFVFLLAPALAWQLSRNRLLDRMRWWLPALITVAILGHVAVIDRNSYAYRFGAGVHDGLIPVGAAGFVKSSGLQGRMFNMYGFGGYLIWSLAPEHKVFIDGREDVYVGPGVVYEYKDCFRSRETWRRLVEKYGIEFAVVDYPQQPPSSPESSLDEIAFPRSDWALVYFDELALVYVRRSGPNGEVIRQHEVRTIQPLQLSGYLDEIVRSPDQEQLFRQELSANLNAHPSSYRGYFMQGIFNVKRGAAHLPEAIESFRQAAVLNPEYVPACLNLANIYAALGRVAEARALYEQVLSREENPAARQQLNLLRGR